MMPSGQVTNTSTRGLVGLGLGRRQGAHPSSSSISSKRMLYFSTGSSTAGLAGPTVKRRSCLPISISPFLLTLGPEKLALFLSNPPAASAPSLRGPRRPPEAVLPALQATQATQAIGPAQSRSQPSTANHGGRNRAPTSSPTVPCSFSHEPPSCLLQTAQTAYPSPSTPSLPHEICL